MDLSEVMFICTANDLSTVPRPLLDRMEIIEVSGYTENEKYHIATEHLMQKQMKKHGLDESKFQISEKAMQRIRCACAGEKDRSPLQKSRPGDPGEKPEEGSDH